MISVADGSFRLLMSVGWNPPNEVFFSPDSRRIVYERPAGEGLGQADVFVLAIDGSGTEVRAIEHGANEAVLGWSPDGTWLLFSSDRTGSWDLWGVRFRDGKPQGSAELLKSGIGKSFEGTTRSLGLTAKGDSLRSQAREQS